MSGHSICLWHPGIKVCPQEWDRSERNHIFALQCRSMRYSFPSTVPLPFPPAPPTWKPLQQGPCFISQIMKQCMALCVFLWGLLLLIIAIQWLVSFCSPSQQRILTECRLLIAPTPHFTQHHGKWKRVSWWFTTPQEEPYHCQYYIQSNIKWERVSWWFPIPQEDPCCCQIKLTMQRSTKQTSCPK